MKPPVFFIRLIAWPDLTSVSEGQAMDLKSPPCSHDDPQRTFRNPQISKVELIFYFRLTFLGPKSLHTTIRLTLSFGLGVTLSLNF